MTSPQPNRRALIRGAAWSVPIVAATASAPARAETSGPCPADVVLPIPEIDDIRVDAADGASSFYTVEPGITQIDFTIAGGRGGASPFAAGGGAGLIQGSFSVAENDMVTFVVGQGGFGQRSTGSTNTGGRGFADGGDVPAPGGAGDTGTSGSGGGASAILLNGTPLVIAGGGGGGGMLEGVSPASWEWSYPSSPSTHAGAFGTAATSSVISRSGAGSGQPSGLITVFPGGNATDAAVGVPSATAATSTFTAGELVDPVVGLPGAEGGSGGAGVASAVSATSAGRFSVGSGAGGGGYRGGASGSSVAFYYASPLGDLAWSIGGNGGAGSNFISTSVTIVSVGTTEFSTIQQRVPGFITATARCV